MKWWPRSLSAALLALLLLGAGSTLLVSSQWDSSARIHPLSRAEHTNRMQAIWQLLTAFPAEADTLLAAVSLPEAHFERRPAPSIELGTMDAQETALAAELRQQLKLPADAALRLSLYPLAAEASGQPVIWTVSTDIPLPDGRWLHSQQRTTMMHPHWDRVLRFSLPMIALSIMLVVLLFSHRIVRPLKTLAQAVGRISRGEPPRPLPLQGPRSVREITAAFNDMHERLDRFITDRTRMIAAISHDLRTPLASLRIRAELISDERLRQDIVRTLDEMAMMAEETLSFAGDDAAREPVQVVNPGTLIDDVVEVQRSFGHPVEWFPPASTQSCHCRPVHLKRALTILLDNAVRYGAGWVKVELQVKGNAIEINIHDNGPGIPEDQLQRVFEPFVRLDAARSMETGGVGLGLAIARSCIRGQGGELRLHNRPEGGLVAVMTLPE